MPTNIAPDGMYLVYFPFGAAYDRPQMPPYHNKNMTTVGRAKFFDFRGGNFVPTKIAPDGIYLKFSVHKYQKLESAFRRRLSSEGGSCHDRAVSPGWIVQCTFHSGLANDRQQMPPYHDNLLGAVVCAIFTFGQVREFVLEQIATQGGEVVGKDLALEVVVLVLNHAGG